MTQKKDISEQNVQLLRRESRNAKVKITEILVQCEVLLRGFYLLILLGGGGGGKPNSNLPIFSRAGKVVLYDKTWE